ncbi:hypothetical protein K457DRAFT_670407 [Linnemannia elongata AG-77]|uniref:Uncharacterized protein n=1 Tax=Linnemannia elongata AG-77 TaxID=1314771 RepID=A0A197JP04_9FUNG|nr:hypothetical protein K457DRAFT_670407 [Linnemannia elongata AG-77]
MKEEKKQECPRAHPYATCPICLCIIDEHCRCRKFVVFIFHSPVLSFPLLLLFAKEIFLGKQLDGVAGKKWDRSLFPSGWWDSCSNRRRTLMLTIF